MNSITSRVNPKGLKLLAKAEFTRDMADNLVSMYSEDGGEQVVSVEIYDWGVWARSGDFVRLFLGSTEALTAEQLEDRPRDVQ